jgi:replicative DNA helicase
MLAAESRIDAWKLRTGKGLKMEELSTHLRDAMSTLSQAPIYIDDQPGNTILKMRAIARRLKAEKNLGLIIVDYLQLMTPTQSRGSDNLVQQITEISRSLKNLARDLDVPVLALSQLSRAVESRGGKPRLSDLRDSGSIEQDADVVMFIHREKDETGEQAKSREATILIEKHRNGPTGEVKLIFDSSKSTFLPVEKADFNDFTEVINNDSF